MLLTISPTGDVRAVYTEAMDLDALGHAEIRRASNVEPGDGGWFAHIHGGPSLGPYPKRSEAITAEIGWIEEHLL